MPYYAGKGGSVTHNAVSYPAKSWSVDMDDNLVEVTNMTSSGWREYISGLRGASFSYEMVFDPTLAQLAPGTTLTNLQLAIGGNYEVTITSGLVRRIRPSTSVDGAAMMSVEGVATGSINTNVA